MPRIRCHYLDCIHLEERYCGAARIEIDPEDGCLTYSHFEEVGVAEEWEEDELEELLEEDDESLYAEEELEDDWLTEDE